MAADGSRGDVALGWMFVAMGAAAVAFVAAMTEVTSHIGAASIPIWGAGVLGVVFLANSPIGKAVARRISGGELEPAARVDVPDEVYAELDELRARMIEMEERQDFAERLLAARPPDQAGDAGGGA